MSEPPNDYVAMMSVDEDLDALQYGVRGMKWGVRKDRSSSSNKSSSTETSSSKKTSEKSPESSSGGGSGGRSAPKPEDQIQNRVESSSDRYDRLASQAKRGESNKWTEQDLKFFNARTEALAKVNKMYEEKPSWLKSTVTEVAKNTAKKQMQSVSDALADKYIGKPLVDSIKGANASSKKKSGNDSDSNSKSDKKSDNSSSSKSKEKSTSDSSSDSKSTNNTKTRDPFPSEERVRKIMNQYESVRVSQRARFEKESKSRVDLFNELRDAGVLDDDD